ncbi:MAG: hypothetical protein AB8C02_09725 [Halioglobus sp.]
MKLPIIALTAVALSLGACASLIQTASVSEAYKHYEREQYDRTLELITQAENTEAMSTDTKAELTYLKAMTYANLGEGEIANTLYEYLAQEHSNSQYGYMAAKKLNSN